MAIALLGCAQDVCLKLGNDLEEGKNFAGMGTQGDDTLVPDPCGLFVLHVFPIPAPDVECEGTSSGEKGRVVVMAASVVDIV